MAVSTTSGVSLPVRLINTDNIRFSKLTNPIAHLGKKNKIDFLLNGSLTTTRSTIGTRVDRNDVVQTSAIDIPREETEGWLIEDASTNEALHNRDFTNVVWIKTNLTALKDAIGHDGVTNTASTLTSTAANGTAFQTVTKASVENTFSIDIRRKTGTGTVEVTDDGGSIFTDVTASLNNVSYTRFSITTTQANPSFGVRIVTSGDEVEVDYSQLEVLPFASSRIGTTTAPVARTADVITAVSLDNFVETGGSVFLKMDILGDNVEQGILSFDDGGANDRHSLAIVSGKFRTFVVTGSVTQVSYDDLDILTINQVFDISYIYGLDNFQTFKNGVSIGVDTLGTPPTGLTKIVVGSNVFTLKTLFGHIQDLRIYDFRLNIDEIKWLGE